jgi:casein kinase 1
MELRVGG